MMAVAILAGTAVVVVLVWLAVRDKRRGDDESVLLGKWRRHRDGA